MTRRSLFRTLAALPLVGRLFDSPAGVPGRYRLWPSISKRGGPVSYKIEYLTANGLIVCPDPQPVLKAGDRLAVKFTGSYPEQASGFELAGKLYIMTSSGTYRQV
jgi:hypothetical protein